MLSLGYRVLLVQPGSPAIRNQGNELQSEILNYQSEILDYRARFCAKVTHNLHRQAATRACSRDASLNFCQSHEFCRILAWEMPTTAGSSQEGTLLIISCSGYLAGISTLCVLNLMLRGKRSKNFTWALLATLSRKHTCRH